LSFLLPATLLPEDLFITSSSFLCIPKNVHNVNLYKTYIAIFYFKGGQIFLKLQCETFPDFICGASPLIKQNNFGT
jgi:hypothetical protein